MYRTGVVSLLVENSCHTVFVAILTLNNFVVVFVAEDDEGEGSLFGVQL